MNVKLSLKQRWALAAYQCAAWLAQPLLRIKIRKRAKIEAGYSKNISERFGYYANTDLQLKENTPFLWLHAVSLGEARVAGLLIESLRQHQPSLRFLLTHSTATGRDEGLRYLSPGDRQIWLPWDSTAAINRFLNHFQPRMGLLIETEVWPNLIHQCAKRNIPIWLINARLNEKSYKAALKLKALMYPAYAGLHAVYAQTQQDAKRLELAGSHVNAITGNLKFDAQPCQEQLQKGQAWRELFYQLNKKKIALLASSRDGEELALLQALLQTKKLEVNASQVNSHITNASPLNTPSASLNSQSLHPNSPQAIQGLIVPRHPQRFDEVALLAKQNGWNVLRRSKWESTAIFQTQVSGLNDKPTIWLGDSIAEMSFYYGLADISLLGASFVPLGGQNLIEACACGCPIIMGPHTFNFAQASSDAIDTGAGWQVENIFQAITLTQQVFCQPDMIEKSRQQALNFAQQHRGALKILTQAILHSWQLTDHSKDARH